MNKFVSTVGLALLLVSTLSASTRQSVAKTVEDFTGTWAGSFIITLDGQTKDDVAHMVLKQNGTELTGTAGPNADQQWAIQKGKVEGNKATFEVLADGPIIKFELTLVDGHLKGAAVGDLDGKALSGVVDLQRKQD